MNSRDALTYLRRAVIRLIWYAAWLTTLVIFFVLIGYSLSSNQDSRTTLLLIAILIGSTGILLMIQSRVLVNRQKIFASFLVGFGVTVGVVATSFF